MKKWMISLLILLALCMGACATTNDIGQASVSSTEDLDLDDYQYLADTFVFPFINGPRKLDDDGYVDRYAFELLDFYALNHPEEVGDVDEDISYRFDAPTVDEYLQRYFLFRDITCMRNGAVQYDADTDEYILTEFSIPQRVCTILRAQREGDILTLEYEYSWPEYADDWSAVSEAILTIELYEDGYRYIGNQKRNHLYPITQDLDYLAEITELYLMRGSILHVYWDNAEETLYKSYMVLFVEENDLLNRHTEEFLAQYGLEKGLDPEPPIDPEILEPLVQQYFEVSSEALRTTQFFGYTDDVVGDLYEGAYRLPLIGSYWWISALHVEEDGDLLYITVGTYYEQNDVVSRPFSISDVTVRVEEDGFKYLACKAD